MPVDAKWFGILFPATDTVSNAAAIRLVQLRTKPSFRNMQVLRYAAAY